MYEDLLEALLESEHGKIKIKSNVVLSTLRRGMNKALDTYKESCELLDMEVAYNHVKLVDLGTNTYSLELQTEKPEHNELFAPKFKFEILEDNTDEEVRTDLDEAKDFESS